MQPTRQSSSRLSSLAAKYLKMNDSELAAAAAENAFLTGKEVRALAASVLAQDETKGQSEGQGRRKGPPPLTGPTGPKPGH